LDERKEGIANWSNTNNIESFE